MFYYRENSCVGGIDGILDSIFADIGKPIITLISTDTNNWV